MAAIFYMETQREAFVSSLAKLTVLNNLREMKSKNIECIKALISIAHTEGNYLQDSWAQARPFPPNTHTQTEREIIKIAN